MKRQQQRPQTITVEMLISVLRQLEPRSRLGILLGGLVATADELGFPEAELVRVVRVASVQRAIAMQVAKDAKLVNAAGQHVMPTGLIDLARPIAWRCPLCDREVPAGVKHKHTAQEWMTGKRVLSDLDDIGEGSNAIGPPAGELEEAALEAMSRVAPLGSVPPDEPPTLDEGVKRRERGVQVGNDPAARAREQAQGCERCGSPTCTGDCGAVFG